MLLAAGCFLMLSCHAGNNPGPGKGEEKPETVRADAAPGKKEPLKDTVVAQSKPKPGRAEAKATAEMCACINSSLKGMSPKIQKIFIRAGNSDRPLQVLQDEMVTISDQEQMELFEQLQRFSTEPQLQKCSDDIRKKYGLDDQDNKAREKILQAARANKDCELVYALIKIGMQQQASDGAGN